MTGCLACGETTAADAWGSTLDLAALLCLEHLAAALTSEAPPARREPLHVPPGQCWGLALTCPLPAVHRYLNARYCNFCAPPPRAPSRGPNSTRGHRSAVEIADEVESQIAVSACLAAGLGTVVRSHAHVYGSGGPE